MTVARIFAIPLTSRALPAPSRVARDMLRHAARSVREAPVQMLGTDAPAEKVLEGKEDHDKAAEFTVKGEKQAESQNGAAEVRTLSAHANRDSPLLL